MERLPALAFGSLDDELIGEGCLDHLQDFDLQLSNDSHGRKFADQNGPVQIADLLRERNDGTTTLARRVLCAVPDCHVDCLLDNVLKFLDDPMRAPGYFHTLFRLQGSVGGVDPAPPLFPQPLLDALADLRGEHLITTLGGCLECDYNATIRLRERLEAEGIAVQGYVRVRSQDDSEGPTVEYSTFGEAEVLETELGERIATVLDAHHVPHDRADSSEPPIQTYPDVTQQTE